MCLRLQSTMNTNITNIKQASSVESLPITLRLDGMPPAAKAHSTNRV